MSLSIQQLFDDKHDTLQLDWCSGVEGRTRLLSVESSSASDQVGYLNLIHPEWIQVLGAKEVNVFHALSKKSDRHRAAYIADLKTAHPPVFIVAQGLTPPDDLQNLCAQEQIALLRTPHPAADIIDDLRVYLSKKLGPSITLHGVFMDVLGLGVLITGESGLGKSELGLELISRRHGLVADDVVEFSRVGPNTIEGRAPELLRHLLEVRGLGLLDIKTIFGETAVRRKMRLKLIAHLLRRSTLDTLDTPSIGDDRLRIDGYTQEVLGLSIKKVIIPIAAGRNIAVLLEAAVRNTILQLRGIDTMQDFITRQRLTLELDGS